MLERVAVHQTRLRTPGIGLDARGVALGAKGLVLLPSIDRLVAFLALYTRQGSLSEILSSLSVELVRSKLSTREVTLSFTADSSDRMDSIAEIARLAGGYTFTGTSRHFVQYRDAAAPFGYDIPQIAPSDAALALYHNAFTQTYDIERKVDLRALILRLEPHPDPSAGREPGPRFILAEAGLGPALIHYFVRSAVNAEVGVAEWPPESSFDDAPVRRYLFRVPEIPDRMLPLLCNTPGLTVFVPASPGAAVQTGYRHPVNLRACPIFPDTSLVLFRGAHKEPLELPRLPAFGDIGAFARVELRTDTVSTKASDRGISPQAIQLALRLVPSTEPWSHVTAAWMKSEDLPVFRRIAYALGAETLRRTRIACTEKGAFLQHSTGIEGIPIGEFYREIHPGLFIPVGYETVPAISPDVLFRSLGSPSNQLIFIGRDSRAVAVPKESFVPLEVALLEAQSFVPVRATELDDSLSAALATEIPQVELLPVGFRPMRDMAASSEGGGEQP